MLKRLVAVLTTVLLAVGLTVGVAMPASAHDANYAATCGSLDLNLVSYGNGANYVTVTIDGTKVEDKALFRNSFTKSYTWSPSASHTFKIEIDAADAGYDKLGANAITGTFGPCTTVTQCINPMTQLKGFTILTEGNFTSDYQGAHVEGTVAVGGDLIANTRYTTQNNHDGTPIPTVDGQRTGLLVGGKSTLNASDQAFSVMQGVFRIGDVPTTAAVKEAKRYHPVSTSSSFIEGTNNVTLDQIKAPGLFASTFAGAFDSLRTQSDKIAAYTKTDVQFVTMANSGNGGKQVTLTSGVTNVLRVSGSTLGSAGQLWFAGGVTPSATTPFIIDVTDSGSFNVTAPVLRNIDEEYVLWNFSRATSIGLYNSEFVKGSILAPRAALSVNSGGIEGQIAASSVVIKSVGEIHHITYKPCATTPPPSTPVTVSTAPSVTNPTCVADGTLVLPSVTGITWAGGTNGAGPGTYTLTATASPGYTLTGQSSWTVVVKPKGDGVNCVESTKPALSIAQCDATSGALTSAFLTIPGTANLVYSSPTINNGAPLTGNVPVAAGTHTVNVVGTNGFTNTGPSSYSIVVAAFDCNKAVAPIVTAAQCDAAGDIQPGFITISSTTPGLEYRIAGVQNNAALSGIVPLAAGSYTVTVTAKPGYTNTGASSFPITITALECKKAIEPALTLAVCHPTTGDFQSAFVMIPSISGLDYRISSIGGGTVQTGKVNLPAGTYTVTVTAKAGVTNTGPSSFTIVVPALECEESVEPTVAVAQCDATGAFVPGTATFPTTSGLEYRIAGVNNGAALTGTVTLAAGSYTVTVTEKPGVTNTGATSFPITIAALECEESVEPTVVIAQCDAATGAVTSATLTAATTPGLTYTIRGGAVLTPGVPVNLTAGTYTVDVTTASGVTNTGKSSFTVTIAAFGCDEAVEPTVTAAQCDATTGPVSAVVTIPSTTPGLVYSIGGTDYAAGQKVDVAAGTVTVDVRALPGYENTGKSSFELTIAAVDCDRVTPVAPTATAETCDANTVGTKAGSVHFTLDSDLVYTFNGKVVTSAVVNDVLPGTYTVSVAAKAGHYLKDGVDSFTVTVAPAADCTYTPIAPTATAETCDVFAMPVVKVGGSLNLTHVAGVQWSVGTQADGSDKVAVGTSATVGKVSYAKPAGTYYVFAESTDPDVAIAPGHESWTLQVKAAACLPTLGLFDPKASATPATCDAFGDSRGTITVDLMDGVAYAFQGGAAITTATTKVAPGTYTVVATATDPGSTLTEDEWVLEVKAASALCELETLALTGSTPVGAIVAAFLLLQVGLGLVAIRFTQKRRARHVA